MQLLYRGVRSFDSWLREEGIYEEVNSPVYARAERDVQRALLAASPGLCRVVRAHAPPVPTRPSLWRRILRRLFPR